MLTTKTSQDIQQNVVTDVNANVVAPGQAKQQYLSPEAALLFNKSLVARPLMVPEVCSIRVKNLEYQYRWVNLAGRNGAMYMQRKAQGFTNATLEDVDILGGDVTSQQSEIRAGDVILMKIRKDLYDAAIKYNMEKAQILQRTRGMYLQGTSPDVNSDSVASRVSVAQESFAKTGKADSFIPANPDALISQSVSMGGAEAARQQTREIREKIDADKAAKK